MINSDLLIGLNKQQREAVVHGEGPLLIIAGAGTGKTKVITHRIAHLISSKAAKPEEILAVTFTEKAASEMEERVDLLIPYSYSYVEVSTFNSFGERVLRNYIHELGFFLDFKLLDDVEQAIFLRENLFRFPLDYYRPLSSPTKHIQEILAAIKRLKQEDIKPEEYIADAETSKRSAANPAENEVAEKHLEMGLVYQKYQQLLREEGKIDFEDQVVLVVDLFRKRPSVLREFREKYKYILVDEFQDTNYIQFELLKLLASNRNLTVVGDDDQSIFRFRGASLSNIQNFRNVYPDAKKVVLIMNYRSTQDILDCSYQLIQKNNPDRLEAQENIDKRLQSTLPSGEKSIHLLQFDTLSHEADKTADLILEGIREGFTYSDMAILVRRNADADPFLRALNMKEIPYRFSGSRGLYAQEEVKLLVSFLRALTDFEDSRSLFFLALSDAYKVDPYDLTSLSNYAQKKHLSLHQVLRLVNDGSHPVGISAETETKMKRLVQDLIYFIQLASTQNAGQILYSFLQRSGILKTLAETESLQGELKIKNVRLFFDKVRNFSDLSSDDSIYAFVPHLDLLQQVGDNPASAEAELESDAVNVLTVHKAKGLEFPIVFMVSLISDRFPGRQRKDRIPVPDSLLKEDLPSGENFIQEERRLFYVGMTRAKKRLYLIWGRDYGVKRLKKVSPFVLEALDLAKSPEDTVRSSALEEIERYTSRNPQPVIPLEVREESPLSLSFFQVDDYLTCPLKYRYRHVMRIPVLPHHNLVYGRIIHSMIHFYLKNRIAGRKILEEEFIEEFQNHWVNEGFLSREHEELRKKEGERALRVFFHREESSKRAPLFLEKSFQWKFEHVRFSGRWDRIDSIDGGAIITDYKATSVTDQKEADRKTAQSLQMDLYALSFHRTQDMPLVETRLHFLESDIIGRAFKGEIELARALGSIRDSEKGIRAQDFKARPDWHNCNLCEFKAICPDSYAY